MKTLTEFAWIRIPVYMLHQMTIWFCASKTECLCKQKPNSIYIYLLTLSFDISTFLHTLFCCLPHPSPQMPSIMNGFFTLCYGIWMAEFPAELLTMEAATQTEGRHRVANRRPRRQQRGAQVSEVAPAEEEDWDQEILENPSPPFRLIWRPEYEGYYRSL